MKTASKSRRQLSQNTNHCAKDKALKLDLAELTTMDAAQLRLRWRQLYRSHPPKRLSRDLLELGVAWKVQERARGGLSATGKRQLNGLVKTLESRFDLAKNRTASLRPGARLLREWHGETHEVIVVDDGFLWRNKTWRSLSAIAREMTGTRWSGPRFFGLTGTSQMSGTDVTTKNGGDL